MKSTKKCPYCGEFEEEIAYAADMEEGENAEKEHVVSECQNYDTCPQYNEKISKA